MSLRVVLLLLWIGCARADDGATQRVVAVGDLHADLPQAEAVLRLAGVLDQRGHWSGGSTVLVQTGDLLDRGPDSRALLALIRRLSDEAPKAGGRVVSLLGNHEVMNMQGDWRYVHPGDLASYGGAAARQRALSPTGADGQWLRQRDVVARVGDTLFVHGGLHPSFASADLEGLNNSFRGALGRRDAPLLGQNGPIWYRGYVEEPEASVCAVLSQALDVVGARRMVVGHTTRRDGKIQTRCAGRLDVIDVGIASHYGGHLAVWEWTDGDARALYKDGAVDLEDPPR